MDALGLIVAFVVGFAGWLLLGERFLVPLVARLTGEEDESEGPRHGAPA